MDQASDATLQDLGARIIDLCGRMHGAECQLLELIRQLDDLHPWNGAMPSCAHWLVYRCGMDIVTAREKVRVAHALSDLPLLSERFRSGELSYSKVRALTRVADADSEAAWVDTALTHTAAQLERIVRQHRQTDTLSRPDAALAAWRHRHLEYRIQDDGSLSFEGRIPAEVGAMLVQALNRALEWMDQEEREADGGGSDSAEARGSGASVEASVEDSAESSWQHAADPASGSVAQAQRPSLAARRADALGLLAERFLAVAPEADEGLQTADRYLLTVHAPVTALPLRARVDPSDPPALEQGPVLATETVRRIGCDAALVRVLESGDGEPLDVGRKTRVIPPALRRALKRRDGGCRFPGCTHTRFVDGHHIVHWADGGETRLDNLVSVCRQHHRLLHEGSYSVVKRDAEFHFFHPNGLRVPEVNDHLRPGELDAELGAGVVFRGHGRAFTSITAPAWRLPRARAFNRTGTRQRANWEAFVNGLRG